MNPRNFFAELKRRNVYRAAVAYGVVAWFLTQLTTQVFPFFDIPNAAIRFVVIALALGFPIAMCLAWLYEFTPEGIVRSEDLDSAKVPSARRATGRILDFIIIGVLLLIIAMLIYQRVPSRTETGETIPQKSIAVLPFENLSSDKENAYFADGIQDEILTKLASIADLKVISRISTAKYKSKPEDLKTVSQQLGVATVLEGSVQRANDKVRVNVQLIDARTDTHLWAKSYDRDFKDIFAVESEVSQGIADALQAKLSPNETSNLAAAPTRDPEAYDLFLRGDYEEHEAETSRKPDAFDRAAAWYGQAIARAPDFALAIARLVESRIARHWTVDRLSNADLDEVKKAADHALAVAPDLAEAHTALGSYYFLGKEDYGPALGELQRALELQPNNVRALRTFASIHARQGHWERCLSEYAQCQRLDPRDAQLVANVGLTYLNLRMWNDAKRAGSHSIALDPHNVYGMRAVLFSYLNGTGDIEEATRVLRTFPPGALLITRAWDLENIIGDRAYVDVIKRDFGAALEQWEKENSDPTANRERLSARVAIHVLAGDAAEAHDEIERARGLVEARLREQPEDKNALTQLSWIELALKRETEALRLARQAAELLPPEKDAMGGPIALAGFAEIAARTGEANEAVKALRRLLSIPAGWTVSIQRLKIDPVWNPIRNDPAFQQLLAGKEQIGPNK